MNFEDVLGNQKVKEILINTINNKNILHSYLFLGTEGIGKKKIAQIFAQKIMCLENSKNNCNCSSCIKFEYNNNPDYKIILPQKNMIKVEQIRQLQSEILEKPITSNRKVYIIDDADSMNEQAQNCLLKTLEEPPAYATIILIVSNETKLLPTIKSRCSKVLFEKLTSKDIKQIVSKDNLLVDDRILKICDGSVGNIYNIMEYIEDYKIIDEYLQKIEEGNIIDILQVSQKLYKIDNLTNLLDYLIVLLFNKKEFNYMNCVAYVEDAKRKLHASSNKEMTIDSLALHIREEINEKNSRS